MKPWKRNLLIVLVVLLFVLLVGPFLVPVPELTTTSTERELADPDSLFLEINNLIVHYKQVGSGETAFILLHGFGASVYSWQQVLDDFGAQGRAIAYDRPAFGLTSRPMPDVWVRGQNPYSVDSNVALLAALMDSLGMEKAILVGNSAGGATAISFALAHPEKVEALILVSPAVSNSGGRFPAWLTPVFTSPQLRHLGPLLVRDIAETGNDTIRQAWHDETLVTDEVIAAYRKPLTAHNWDRALYEFTFAPRSEGLRNRVAELKMPVLVITGDDDRIVPTQNSIDLAQEFNLPLVVLPACGHVPQEECPELFMEAVNNFLEGLK